ncbi:MAG: hypothetical protein WCP29_14685 [Acidobacteriota bacterium]
MAPRLPSPPVSPPVFALNIHADYHCRRQGACCTAGWHVPIETDRFDTLRSAMANGRLVAPDLPSGGTSTSAPDGAFLIDNPPHGAAAVVGLDASGTCVFFDRRAGRRCAIHHACGHDHLPLTCQQFPRVALIDARGVLLTLSHFCPTAAKMLLRDDVGRLAIVTNPSGAILRNGYEGFDAGGTIPPLIRPHLVSDLAVAAAWDAFVVHTFGCDDATPEAAISRLAHAAESIRAWRPGTASLATLAEAAFGSAASNRDHRTTPMSPSSAGRLFLCAAMTTPRGLSRPALPADLDHHHTRLVAPVWASLARPVRRYLAAKAFGAWSAYIGEGLRTQIAMVALALGVLRVEATRQAAEAGRELDEDLFVEAVRQSDLLLVHLASEYALVRRMGRVEAMTREAYSAEIGIDLD